MYVDAAIVPPIAWSVCLSVYLSDTILSPAKTAEPIEMQCGLWTRVGLRNQVDGCPDPPSEGPILRGRDIPL